MNTLVVYSSRFGQTEAIARHIANFLEATGSNVDTITATRALALDSIEPYDRVILGSPIYIRTYSKHLVRFIKGHLGDLKQKKTGFFSVSLSAAGSSNQRQDATSSMRCFLTSCNWQPGATRIFAGALPYRKYNWFLRWLMMQIARRAGGDCDTTRDFEYTDWG